MGLDTELTKIVRAELENFQGEVRKIIQDELEKLVTELNDLPPKSREIQAEPDDVWDAPEPKPEPKPVKVTYPEPTADPEIVQAEPEYLPEQDFPDDAREREKLLRASVTLYAKNRGGNKALEENGPTGRQIAFQMIARFVPLNSINGESPVKLEMVPQNNQKDLYVALEKGLAPDDVEQRTQ